MAALRRKSLSPESKPFSRVRHVHDGRHEPRSRSPKVEYRHSPPRSSPPYQLSWSSAPQQYLPTPNSSQLSLSPLVEHDRGITMERTPSGSSILSDTPFDAQHHNTFTCSDEEAANRVMDYKRYRSHRKHEHERILRTLMKRDLPLDKDDLDDDALAGILTTADSVFFGGALRGRVRWEWSSQDRYHTDLIGTTALRPCSDGDGFETLIVLSQPILRDDEQYDRRLLLSAFIHELIHCYLFIMCGFNARKQGGHTQGFHSIAEVIDKWAGEGYLSLCNMKANLNHFRRGRANQFVDPRLQSWGAGRHGHEGCNQSPRPHREYYDDSDISHVSHGFVEISA